METRIRKVTRKDVAQEAEVTETVVSYVLNNNRYVAQDKRERVLAAVEKLHYRPDTAALALKGKLHNHILFIADDISNEYFGMMVSEMDKIAHSKGYYISLMATSNSEDFVSEVLSRHIDGIVISSTSLDEKYAVQLSQSGVPLVLLMNKDFPSVSDAKVSKIYTGLQDGIKEGTRLLVDRGRKNIFYIDRISKHGRFGNMSDVRYSAFVNQMRKTNLAFDINRNIITGYSSEEDLFKGIAECITSGMKIDGIVARNDNLACVAIKAVQSCGLIVPDDVSVIGFDNSRIGRYINPPLTTMEINRVDIAQAVITMIDGMITGEKPCTMNFSTKLIRRESI